MPSPTPGYVFKDGQAIPDDELQTPVPAPGTITAATSTPATATAPIATPAQGRESSSPSGSSKNNPDTPTSIQSTLMGSNPSESHELAAADHGVKGAAQLPHNEVEVKDMGWQEHPKDIPTPLVGGLKNDDLWMLVRRFDKQMYHVKATPNVPLGGLDLNIADKDEFSPDKLRANLERLYMTAIIGVIGLGKHIARLRSWREPRRTAAFAAAYAVAWVFNFLMPLLFTTMIVLIVYPPSRPFMFPPAPIALVNAKTGGVQSPKAGVLGSHDSATGAPENHKGEAVEQEASNFVSGFATIAMSSATGKHEQSGPNEDSIHSNVPDPADIVVASADAKTSAAGGEAGKAHDKTKQPMEDAMWEKMRPIMHVIGDIADGWERFANALSPTSPFPKGTPRLKLAGILVPGVLVSAFVTNAMFMKGVTFGIGFGFFGNPVIERGIKLLNEKIPDWPKYLELRNTILKGIPTNAQLTITLLRIGEANHAPLPPPPSTNAPPPDRPKSLNGDDLEIDASNTDIDEAIHGDKGSITTADAQTEPPKKKHGSGVLRFLKGSTRAVVETKIGTDSLRAAAGSMTAKNHLGILPKPEDEKISGPVDFRARYQGKKGWIYINTSATIPCVSFSFHERSITGEDTLKPVWSVPIDDIQEIKKIGGLGWKGKLVVGWATDRNVADGLEIIDKQGQTWKTTAITLRDELFNRLVSMGGQKWESW